TPPLQPPPQRQLPLQPRNNRPNCRGGACPARPRRLAAIDRAASRVQASRCAPRPQGLNPTPNWFLISPFDFQLSTVNSPLTSYSPTPSQMRHLRHAPTRETVY